MKTLKVDNFIDLVMDENVKVLIDKEIANNYDIPYDIYTITFKDGKTKKVKVID